MRNSSYRGYFCVATNFGDWSGALAVPWVLWSLGNVMYYYWKSMQLMRGRATAEQRVIIARGLLTIATLLGTYSLFFVSAFWQIFVK